MNAVYIISNNNNNNNNNDNNNSNNDNNNDNNNSNNDDINNSSSQSQSQILYFVCKIHRLIYNKSTSTVDITRDILKSSNLIFSLLSYLYLHQKVHTQTSIKF